MPKLTPPPISEPIVDNKGIVPFAWALFFDQMHQGDRGTDFTPVFTNLSQVGAPTITGRYYRISQRLIYFRVSITPGTNTSSTAGTTYFTLPFSVLGDGACLAVSGLLGSNSGMIDRASGRCYPPGWSAVTVPLSIVGMVEAQ